MTRLLLAGLACLVASPAFAQAVSYRASDGLNNSPVSAADPLPVASQPSAPSAMWRYAAATGGIVNTTTAVTIKAAAGAGVKNYVRSCHVAHDTLGAATELAIQDGAGGTVLGRLKLQTTATEGQTVDFPVPLAGTANTLLEVVTLTAVTGGVFVNCQGFTG